MSTNWTRDDLPDADDVSEEYHLWVSQVITVLDAVVSHLNAHHPKPELRVTANVAETDAALRYELMGAYGARDRMRVLLGEAERERDAAVERAEQAEREVSTWRTSTESAHNDFLQAAHDRDEARTRLREVCSIAAVSHDEVKQAMQGQWGGSFDAILAAVWALVSGADPAVYVVRESDIAAVEVQSIDGGKWWLADGALVNTPESPNENEAREAVEEHLAAAAGAEAVARAIEAEQAVDPVEAKARELWEVARFEDSDEWSGLLQVERDCYRRMAAHVLGREAGDGR